MSDDHNRILSLFTGCKKRKLGIRLEENICQGKEDAIYLKQTEDHITIKRNG